MHKLLLILYVISLIGPSTIAHAQLSLGLQAGIGQNYLSTNIDKLSYTNNVSQHTPVLSLPISYTFCSWFSLQTAITYIQKNYSLVRNGPYTGIYETFKNTYLQLPLLASFEYRHKKISGFAIMGVFAAYWVRASVKGKTPAIFTATDNTAGNDRTIETFGLSYYNEPYVFDTKRDRRYQLGWAAGGGLEYLFDKNNSIVAEISFFQSLTDKQNTYMLNQSRQFDQTSVFSLGYKYSFGRKNEK